MYSSATSRGTSMLHGHLILKVIEAKDLPNMEGFLSTLVNKNDVTDPFVEIKLGSAKLGKTRMILNSLNPVWNENFRIELCHVGDVLRFEVNDRDHVGAEHIGTVEISTSSLMDEEVRERWFPIMSKKNKVKGQLKLSVQFVSKDRSIQQGYEVDCYFSVQRNCLVTLYQDAHCNQMEPMPQFKSLPFPHTPQSCWKDVYNAFMEARHFICITGWSVWHKLQLLRGDNSSLDQRTLGEILAEKANQGVNVYIMIWEEPGNTPLVGETALTGAGLAGTNDEVTYNFFKSTRVHCAKVPRQVEYTNDAAMAETGQNLWTKTYSHHQKSIICDAAGPGTTRRLVAFVGGIDLTNGINRSRIYYLRTIKFGFFHDASVY